MNETNVKIVQTKTQNCVRHYVPDAQLPGHCVQNLVFGGFLCFPDAFLALSYVFCVLNILLVFPIICWLFLSPRCGIVLQGVLHCYRAVLYCYTSLQYYCSAVLYRCKTVLYFYRAVACGNIIQHCSNTIHRCNWYCLVTV